VSLVALGFLYKPALESNKDQRTRIRPPPPPPPLPTGPARLSSFGQALSHRIQDDESHRHHHHHHHHHDDDQSHEPSKTRRSDGEDDENYSSSGSTTHTPYYAESDATNASEPEDLVFVEPQQTPARLADVLVTDSAVGDSVLYHENITTGLIEVRRHPSSRS